MKALNGIIKGIRVATKFMKLFECISAGLEAFEAKAVELKLYTGDDEATK